MKYLLVLFALVGVPANQRRPVVDAYLAERSAIIKKLGARFVPAPEIVAAIIEHESRGRSFVCREDKGGASRGLMQVWCPHSYCASEDASDDPRYGADYDPATNVREGVYRLATNAKAELRHHPRHEGKRKRVEGHDSLEHYAGSTGITGKRFARWVRRRAAELRRKAKHELRSDGQP